MRKVMSRVLAAAAAFLFLLSGPRASAQTSSKVPTPESVLGKRPGDDFYLASYDESRAYFQRLAEASDRVRLIKVGKTTRGLDWEIAIISAPENLAKLDRYKEISQRLADGRRLDDAAASQAKLELGVLTLTLAKLQPASKATTLPIN